MAFRSCRNITLITGALYLIIGVSTASAQSVDISLPGKPIYVKSSEIESERKRDNWSGTLGLGLSLAPDFLGADSHSLTSALQVRVNYRDKIFLENNRLGAVLYTSRFLKGGVIGRWNLGREDDVPLRFATGAEPVDDTFELGMFAATSLYKLFLAGEVYVGLEDAHRGINVELEGGYTFELNSKLKLSPILGAKWGSQKFNQAFFGIEDGNDVFPAYRASSGIYEVYGVVSLEQRLGKNWLLKGSMRLAELTNSAARSPIIASDIGNRYQLSSYVGVVWLF